MQEPVEVNLSKCRFLPAGFCYIYFKRLVAHYALGILYEVRCHSLTKLRWFYIVYCTDS